MTKIISTRRDRPFLDSQLKPTLVSQRWIEEVSRSNNDIDDTLSDHESRITELEPSFVVIDSADSPFAASNNDYILADMSSGDVTITLPASGRLSVSRSGSSNTLTLTGTINGVANPTIISDGDSPSIAFIGTEWRYV